MDYQPPHYPVVNFLVKHGKAFAFSISALVPLLGLYLSLRIGDWIYLPIGVVAGGVLLVILKSYMELVHIIADMLLPK